MNDNQKFPADDEHQIDNLFRQTLGDHTVEPSESLWLGVSRKLLWKEITRFKFTNLPPKYWLAGTAVVAVIVGLIFLYPGSQQSMQLKSYQGTEISPTGNSGKVSGSVGNKDIRTENAGKNDNSTNQSHVSDASQATYSTGHTTTNQHADKPASSYTVLRRSNPAYKGQGIASVSRPSPNPAKNTGENSLLVSGESSALLPVVPSEGLSLAMIKSLESSGLYIENFRDTIISFRTSQGIMRVQKDKPLKVQSFSTDFGVTPEWISYKTTHSYSEMNYWLNANISYHFSRFSIKTGVALGYVYDEGKYSIKYLSKDSIGYFTSVISFYVNPENQNELIFNTKNVAVYDSLQHFTDDRTRNRYTYLEFPLLIGYQLFETNNLSLDIMAGPAFTLLIGTREAAPFIDYQNARIIRIDENTPERVKMNWKIALSLHLEYRVTRNLGCYLEPSYKYYFNSFTKSEEKSGRDPYSIGVGLGIRYHFGQIKK
jgi:hypothetical protein